MVLLHTRFMPSLLDYRCWASHLQYLVDWEGFGLNDRSWVPTSDVFDHSLMSDFHAAHLSKLVGATAAGPSSPP